MSLPWPSLLVVLSVVAFAGVVIWKVRPALPLRLGSLANVARRASPQRSHELKEEVRRARAEARGASTPRARAEALIVAGRASALLDEGGTAALGFYLRAVRADASYCEPLRAICELLHDERPELLETVLWRRLAQLSWSGDSAPAARCAVEGLVSLYRHDLPHRERARALQKLLTVI